MTAKIRFVLSRIVYLLLFCGAMPFLLMFCGKTLAFLYPESHFLHSASINYFTGMGRSWILLAGTAGLLLALTGLLRSEKQPLIISRTFHAGVILWNVSVWYLFQAYETLPAGLVLLVPGSAACFFSEPQNPPLKHDRIFHLIQSGYLFFLISFLFQPGFSFLMLTPWKWSFLILCAGLLIPKKDKRDEFYLLSFVSSALCGLLCNVLGPVLGDTVLMMDCSIVCCQLWFGLEFFLLIRAVSPWKRNLSVVILMGGLLLFKLIPNVFNAMWSVPMGIFLFYIFLDNLFQLPEKICSPSGRTGKFLRKFLSGDVSLFLFNAVYWLCGIVLILLLDREDPARIVSYILLLASAWFQLKCRWERECLTENRVLASPVCLLTGMIFLLCGDGVLHPAEILILVCCWGVSIAASIYIHHKKQEKHS